MSLSKSKKHSFYITYDDDCWLTDTLRHYILSYMSRDDVNTFFFSKQILWKSYEEKKIKYHVALVDCKY